MGSRLGPYNPDFPVGTRVMVRDLEYLQKFHDSWKLHNRLLPEQLKYAGETAVVKDIAFYHGGDELYTLDGIPGVWHEHCLIVA